MMGGSHIGAEVKKERLKQNLSLRDLAEQLGLSHQTIARVEAGKLLRTGRAVEARVALAAGIPAARVRQLMIKDLKDDLAFWDETK